METLMLERKERNRVTFDKNGGWTERKDKKEEGFKGKSDHLGGGGQRERNIKVGRTWRIKVKGGDRECRRYRKNRIQIKMAKLFFKSKAQS